MRIALGDASLAENPDAGGHWMVYLQYLLGLKDLGHEVLLVELLRRPAERARERFLLARFFDRLDRYGLADHAVVFLFDQSYSESPLEAATPVTRSASAARVEMADVVWNIAGHLNPAHLQSFRRSVLIDLDPGHLQVSAYEDWLKANDVFFTIGMNLGTPESDAPTLGLHWQRFLPFVYLPLWDATPRPLDAAFASVTQWNWDELIHLGRRLSISKREAYLRYLDLPTRSGRRFQLAANLSPADSTGDRELLEAAGWEVLPPSDVAGTPESYAAFIAGSDAEISCPKPIFRELRTGWFSDRSAGFLAAGRPVLAEDTGIGRHLPVGRGLVTFDSMESAVDGVRRIDRDWQGHAKSARQMAEAFLDSRPRLAEMVDASA